MWIKNSDGKPDAMLTFATISFLVITFNLLMSTFGTVTIDGHSIAFQALDSSAMAAYLGATFTAYVSRRWTEKHYDSKGNATDNDASTEETK